MVYNLYTMQRTQVYLRRSQVARLRSAARASQRTVSDVIREAIDEKLAKPADIDSLDSALDRVAGIWSDREDLGSTDEYVRRLRRDRRGSPAL